ncbi:hypothetical protein QE152_g24386 [Popillia japonica]|uniref:Reverse transcriptase zinc-binding domain-containing protein n=1 Tax=Popillia japonica TaxID=7064 RepID=A0AAW1KFK5_POPJA
MNDQAPTQYGLIYPTINCRAWYANLSVLRWFYSTIARLKFGHGQFPTHLYRLHLIESPACSCGNVKEDINHLFLECDNFTADRKEMLRELSKMKVEFPTNMVQILRHNNINVYRVLMKYIKSTNILI